MLGGKLIALEGNNGSGKSLLLETLKKRMVSNSNVIFLNEPIEAWMKTTNKDGRSLFELYCESRESDENVTLKLETNYLKENWKQT